MKIAPQTTIRGLARRADASGHTLEIRFEDRNPFSCERKLAGHTYAWHTPKRQRDGRYRCTWCGLLVGRPIKPRKRLQSAEPFAVQAEIRAAEYADTWEDRSAPMTYSAMQGWLAHERDSLRDGPPDEPLLRASWEAGYLARQIWRHGLDD